MPSDRASGLRASRCLDSAQTPGDHLTSPPHTLWAREVRTLRGPSHWQRALQRIMVLKVDKLVALATFHPRNLVFWGPQALAKRILSTTASQVIAVVEGDPRCVQGA